MSHARLATLALALVLAGCHHSAGEGWDAALGGPDAAPAAGLDAGGDAGSWQADASLVADAAERADGSSDAAMAADAAASVDASAPSDAAYQPGNLIEIEDLTAKWDCDPAEGCTAGYDAFPGKVAAANHHPISETDLLGQLWDIQVGNVDALTTPLPASELRDKVLDDANIRFLYDGLMDRPLKVTTIAKDQSLPDYDQRELLLEDPYLGTFYGILLTPKGGGPFPGVVAIHGHGDKAAVYRDDYHGKEWPSHGYAILMLTMRVMGIDLDEHNVSHDLLIEGFTLIGIRVYESLLGLKYLRSRAAVDPYRVGLIGHSGGSSTSNLTVRIEPAIKVYVSDCQVDWYSSSPTELYHCETAPNLYPYNLLINDFTTSQTPVKAVPYGYTNGMAEIFDFFDQHLK